MERSSRLAEINGNVGAVEVGKSGRFMNSVIANEVGHMFGLEHQPGTIMNPSIDTNPDNNNLFINAKQASGLWLWILNRAPGVYNHDAGHADHRQAMKDFIFHNDIQ